MKTTVSLTAAAISLLFASPASASAWFQNKLDQKGIPDVSVTIMRWGALDSANPTEKKDRIIGQVASDKFKNVTLVLEGIGADQKPVRLEIATSVHNFCKDRPPYYCTISGCLRKQPSTSIGVATQGASTSGGCFFEISPPTQPGLQSLRLVDVQADGKSVHYFVKFNVSPTITRNSSKISISEKAILHPASFTITKTEPGGTSGDTSPKPAQ